LLEGEHKVRETAIDFRDVIFQVIRALQMLDYCLSDESKFLCIYTRELIHCFSQLTSMADNGAARAGPTLDALFPLELLQSRADVHDVV
jgi:hypothetical protein